MKITEIYGVRRTIKAKFNFKKETMEIMFIFQDQGRRDAFQGLIQFLRKDIPKF